MELIAELQQALVAVQAAYSRAQYLWDRATSREAKEANLDAMARWNQADKAIRRAITHLGGRFDHG